MKYLLILLMLILRNFTFGQEVSRENIPVLPPVHQLRIYEIPKENKQVFLGRFREHAMRIMKKYGFVIVATWKSESKDRTKFVYLPEWKDKAAMKTAWER